jgi:hypothetical protein
MNLLGELMNANPEVTMIYCADLPAFAYKQLPSLVLGPIRCGLWCL